VTTVFEHEAAVQRAALGMEALRPVVVTHPLSTLTAEQLDARAREAAPQVIAIWTATSSAAAPAPNRPA
jgi:hypothetical protein